MTTATSLLDRITRVRRATANMDVVVICDELFARVAVLGEKLAEGQECPKCKARSEAAAKRKRSR